MSDKFNYELSQGNVFADIGLSNPDERLAKAKLASKIVEIAKEKKLTQIKMAVILEIDQPKVSDLFRGRLSAFSITRLIKFLTLLEKDVEIIVKDKSDQHKGAGHLCVKL